MAAWWSAARRIAWRRRSAPWSFSMPSSRKPAKRCGVFFRPEGAAAQRKSAVDGWKIARISASEFRVQSSDDIARLDRRAVDQPIATMDQKSTVTGAWKNIPHLAYIRAAGQPRATFAQFAEVVKRDPKWQYFEVPCGHNVMLD